MDNRQLIIVPLFNGPWKFGDVLGLIPFIRILISVLIYLTWRGHFYPLGIFVVVGTYITYIT